MVSDQELSDIPALLQALRHSSTPLVLPEEGSILTLERRVIRRLAGHIPAPVNGLHVLNSMPVPTDEPGGFFRSHGAHSLGVEAESATLALALTSVSNRNSATLLAPAPASESVVTTPPSRRRSRKRLPLATSSRDAHASQLPVLASRSTPSTEGGRFFGPCSLNIETVSGLVSPSATATQITVLTAKSPVSTCRPSLILPRATNPEILGCDQITEALTLHNLLSHRGYVLDWADGPASPSRTWRSVVLVEGHTFGVGVGSRKAEARQAAAAEALDYLRTHPNALPSKR